MRPGSAAVAMPACASCAAPVPEDFSALDEPEARARFAEGAVDGTVAMAFHVEGAECASCITAIESLPKDLAGVVDARVDLGTGVVRIRLRPDETTFARVAGELARRGFPPRALAPDREAEAVARDDRAFLSRLGVAAFCVGNLMILAVAVYAGAEGMLARDFNRLSFLLFLPVLLYSATPLYRGAFGALRGRRMSIDVPIVFGLAVGTLTSLANLASGETGRELVYFDSLAMVVFLLLGTRYALRRAVRRAEASARMGHQLVPLRATRMDAATGARRLVAVDALVPGDRVEVLAGEAVPCDGVLVSDHARLDLSLLTGESSAVKLAAGAEVHAGTINVDGPALVEVAVSGHGTRLSRLLESVEEGRARKAGIALWADAMGRRFAWLAIAGSGLAFALGLRAGGFVDGMNRALALSIVICPCVFALATPLAFTRTLGRLARRGILVRGAEALERLAGLNSVYLDKTGTLTRGNFEVVAWEAIPGVDVEPSAAVAALESRSRHPVARALRAYLADRVSDPLPAVDGFREAIGEGVSGTVDGHRYVVGRLSPAPADGATWVGVRRDGELVARVALGDAVRPDSRRGVDELRSLGLEVFILSGDSAPAVASVAREVGIDESRAISGASPEEKRRVVADARLAGMVGDGANDASALAAAHAGIAVHGGIETCLRAADAHYRTPGVRPVAAAITAARETLRVVRRGFVVSLGYNAIAATAALTGHVTPLLAAVLMPASAALVIGAAILGTRRLRRATEAA